MAPYTPNDAEATLLMGFGEGFSATASDSPHPEAWIVLLHDDGISPEDPPLVYVVQKTTLRILATPLSRTPEDLTAARIERMLATDRYDYAH